MANFVNSERKKKCNLFLVKTAKKIKMEKRRLEKRMQQETRFVFYKTKPGKIIAA